MSGVKALLDRMLGKKKRSQAHWGKPDYSQPIRTLKASQISTLEPYSIELTFNELDELPKGDCDLFTLAFSAKGKPTGRYWLAMQFRAPANLTIVCEECQEIHQIWELLKKNHNNYEFKFQGYPPLGTERFEGRVLRIHKDILHAWLRKHLERNPNSAAVLLNTAGLEHLQCEIDKWL